MDHTTTIGNFPAPDAVYKDRVKLNKRHERFHFVDMSEFLANVPVCKPRVEINSHPWEESSWSGNVTMQQAHGMARNGWLDGAQQAAELSRTLQLARPTKRSLSRQCRVAGAVPDVQRAIAGNPEHMRQIATREAPNKVVTLLVDIFVSCSLDANRLVMNAVSAGAIVDAMESAGFRVEVWARCLSGTSDGTIDISINTKRSDQPLDLSAFAFTCGHVAMLRKLCFGMLASHDHCRWIGQGHGYPCYSVPDAALGMYIIPAMQNNLPDSTDIAEIFDGMVSSLREQGCPGLSEGV